MSTVPHVLSPDDSAHAAVFARAIHATAEPLNRQVISRYGMDLFQGIQPTATLHYDCMFILYRFPHFAAYVTPFIDDGTRCEAFENTTALLVHSLCVGKSLPEAAHV